MSSRFAQPHAGTISTRSLIIDAGTLPAVAVFGGLVLLAVLMRPLLAVDETRYFSVAWEMWQDSSFLVPHLNGEAYSHKPPLLFWLINVAWYLFGTDSIVARLVAPAFGMLSIWLTARLARRLWPDDHDSARLAPWILATTGAFLLLGSLTAFDAMLSSATLLALTGILLARRSQDYRAWLVVGLGMAFGGLAKGPVILLHVLPVALLLPVWAERSTRPALGRWYAGIALSLLTAIAIVAVWLVPALQAGGPEYQTDILWRQHAGRVVDAFAHQRPFWFYLAGLPLLTWPWTWSRRVLGSLTSKRMRVDEGLRFCIAWAVAALFLFSLSAGKQMHYLLPELPAVALLVARAGYGSRAKSRGEAIGRPYVGLALPALLLLAGLAVSLGLSPALAGKDLLMPANSVIGASAVLAGLLLLVLRLHSRLASWALLAPALLLMVHLLADPVLHRAYDPSAIGRHLAVFESQGIAIAYSDYDGEFTYAGRLTRPLGVLRDDAAVAAWTAGHPGGAIITRKMIDDPSLRQFGSYNYRGRIYYLFEVDNTSVGARQKK
ncbi:MAG TPA: glycosyltransferase family 39 protein [Woeseiaceae bacterium]|nr:glycosyltransferase family 39 protein [Woeseiaceae bacterium]